MGDFAPEGAALAPAGVEAFVGAADRLPDVATLDQRLRALASALAAAAAADTVVVRLADELSGRLVARGVASSSPAFAGELEGSSIDAYPGEAEIADRDGLPADLRRLCERAGATTVFVAPARGGGRVVGEIELLREGQPFSEPERVLARLAAGQVALLVGAGADGEPADELTRSSLELLGEALAAGEGARVSQAIVRLGARAVGARAGLLWELAQNGASPRVAASWGFAHGQPVDRPPPEVPEGRRVLVTNVGAWGPPRASVVATVGLGEPPAGALELFLPAAPSADVLDALGAFAARAGQALRASRRAVGVAAELERTRALLRVVGQAIEKLSLPHTLETVVDQVGELLDTERVAVYLPQEAGLRSAFCRGLTGPHEEVAAALLGLALGPLRARGAIVVEDAGRDPRLSPALRAVATAGIEAAVAVPLEVSDEAIGLLAVYLPRGRVPSGEETALLVALAAQLGIAVQNAQLHEESERVKGEKARALAAEQEKARELQAFYEVSESFTAKMSLEETLSTLVRTIVELVDADAAVIRTHDRRRNALVPHDVYVADEDLRPAVGAMLDRPHVLDTPAARALVDDPRPQQLTPALAGELGEAYELLAPFLDRGATAAIVPVARAGELIAAVTVVSLDPERPLDDEALAAASKLAAQAALAVDNARLYQQQQDFVHAMQRALLPQSLPRVRGLELARAYEPGGRLEVGGDVYDFLPLDDHRLAVVLGDVTGHGAEAAADMAMVKFVFRSLAREHSDPADFLAAANDVVSGELALGKFVTMVYLVVDGRSGDVRCAVAGHPAPRIVRAGRVEELDATGVALGIDPGQRYDEVSTSLGEGDALLLYTDGVVEARRDQELYGSARLDEVLAAAAGGSADSLASAVLEDCRAYAGGELDDDCAIVVVKRVGAAGP